MQLAAAVDVESPGANRRAVETLHDRCGIYTKPGVVKQILNAVGWTTRNDLSEASLLEPSAGDGAFLAEAARRLVLSLRRRGTPLSITTLGPRIRSYELHPREAEKARKQVNNILVEIGVHGATADACARVWISNTDFLLAKLESNSFSHVVGNPPYVRWSKIPTELRLKYEQSVPRELTGGDLFVPFLDRALDALKAGCKCGLLCSDRWRYMAFGEAFRSKWLPRLDVHSEKRLTAENAFVESVESYPTILFATKRAKPLFEAKPLRRRGDRVTLPEAGCTIRVGPALGHTPAFVLERDELDAEVESEFLAKWVAATEISEGKIAWAGRRVVIMNDANGDLIDLNGSPRLSARLDRYREKLSARAIVKNGAPWFRPIDRVRKVDWERPKILLPELAKTPRCAIDRSGLIPSHGVYAIFAPDDDVDWLYRQLDGGQLANALRKLAPRVRSNYVRCYKRFLEMVKVTPR